MKELCHKKCSSGRFGWLRYPGGPFRLPPGRRGAAAENEGWPQPGGREKIIEYMVGDVSPGR
jgi:hypothetical protein